MKKLLFLFLLLTFSCTQEDIIEEQNLNLEGLWWDGEHRSVIIIENNSMFFVRVPDPYDNMGEPDPSDAAQEWDIIIEEINGQHTIEIAGGFYCLEEIDLINVDNYCETMWQVDCLSEYFYKRVDASCN